MTIAPERSSQPNTTDVRDAPPLPKVRSYQAWQEEEGVPVITGFYVPDIRTLELAPWPRKGGRGAFVNLEGTGGVNDMHVVEISAGASSEPEHHLYEEMVYVVSGRGSTSVWYDERYKQTFEWGPGSLFAIPLNAWYQHHNGSGVTRVRYASVTNAPTVLGLFHNRKFVFDNPFQFEDRFSGQDGYFEGGRDYAGRNWVTNFVPDTRAIALHNWKARGGAGRNLMLELAENSMGAHISEFEIGTYKKAHRHGPGAHVIILEGDGFSLLWKDAGDEPTRVDWTPNSLVVPPNEWFHQHFNTGPEPARYLALRFTGFKFHQPNSEERAERITASVKEGGWQIEYEDEDPGIHRLFEAELARHGASCHMLGLVPGCTGTRAE